MPENPMTVRRFFFGRREPHGRVGRQLGRAGQLDELQKGLGKELGKVKWKVVAKEIGKQIASVLDFGVAEKILAPAWQRWQLLQEYRDTDKHPPGESALVPLYEHTVRSSHRPHIDLLAKDVEIGRLTLQVELALDINGVVLRIKDGRIWGIESGSAAGRGSLACNYAERSIYKLERKSRRFKVNTGIGFKEGLEIPKIDLDLE